MVSKEQISKVIFEVIRDYNSEVPVDRRILESPDSVLYGPSGNLDSLGLVNFVISAEQKIEEVFNTPVTLADEKAMSQRTSPFKSVESLVNYISFLLEENNDK